MEHVEQATRKLIETPDSPFYMAVEPVDNGHNQSYSVFVNGPHTLAEFTAQSIEQGVVAKRDFCVYRGERTTYAQLRDRINALAAGLAADFGIRPGDRVAISMRNFPEWPLSYLAAISIGGVAVPLNGWWTGPELAYGLSDSGSKVLICDQERFERAVSAGALRQSGIKAIVVRPTNTLRGRTDCVEMSAVLSKHAGLKCPDWGCHRAKDDPAVIMYTSGTTGKPKGVVQTHRNILTQTKTIVLADAISEALGAPEPQHQTCMIATVPLFHVTGSQHIFMATLAKAGKLCLMYKWDPREALRLIESEKVTGWTGVPTMVQELMALPDFRKTDLSSLKGMGGGGAAMPKTLVKIMQQKLPSATPTQGYGLTEVNGGCIVISGADFAQRPTSTGKPYFYMQARTVDSRGIDLSGGRGELQLRGALTMREYWNKPEKTAEAITADGWFATGDVATIDSEGFVYIVDRIKDLVIRGGENISCTEVEHCVYETCDAVFEAAVFGIPDKRLGEVVAMMVRTKPGMTITEEELIATIHRAGKLAKFKVPERVFFTTDPLPRGATEKIQRREIKRQVLALLQSETESSRRSRL